MQKKKKNLFSQTKNYFFYFNITLEMSYTVVFLVFGVLNTIYSAFRILDTSTLILGWQGFLFFILKFSFY